MNVRTRIRLAKMRADAGGKPLDTWAVIPVEDLTEAPGADPSYHGRLDLIESVRKHGVVSPILVRPLPPGDRPTELQVVFGHRRLRAAKEAGLQEIAAMVRDLTDEEAMELQYDENAQRT